MDAKFQPSFIPKQPGMPLMRSVSAHISVFYVIASMIFIVTLGLMGASLIAERSMRQSVEALNQELVSAEASFELSTIEELKRVSFLTSIALGLLNKHVALSKFLEELGNITYSNVAFSNLSMSAQGDSIKVSLSGIAGSYNTIILQSDFLEQRTYLKQPTFSGFSLNENGSVSFTLDAGIEPSLVDYKKYITSN